jgi:hypothetical protein
MGMARPVVSGPPDLSGWRRSMAPKRSFTASWHRIAFNAPLTVLFERYVARPAAVLPHHVLIAFLSGSH